MDVGLTAVYAALAREFPGAAYDRWKGASDLDGQECAKTCYPCEQGDHDKCWNAPGYDRCVCWQREHKKI
jgi:hypothetical protein